VSQLQEGSRLEPGHVTLNWPPHASRLVRATALRRQTKSYASALFTTLGAMKRREQPFLSTAGPLLMGQRKALGGWRCSERFRASGSW
jgi:hypothetical protein